MDITRIASKQITETTKPQLTLIQKICNKLGENNKPIYTVLCIACGKGTVRPILSITDKKEKPDARKYAALRELMTEFIGVPTTICAGLAAESLTGLIAHRGSTAFKNTKSVLSFLGICTAAGYLVPKFCNMFMPPVMKKLMPNYDPNAKVDDGGINLKSITEQKKPGLNSSFTSNMNVCKYNNLLSTYFHSGMKV